MTTSGIGVRSREVSPFDLITWFMAQWADDPVWANPGNGNAVSSWRDGSGNSRNVVQASGTKQPIFSTGVALLNNRSAVVFDGVNDSLALTVTRAQTFSVIWIGTRNGTGSTGLERIVGMGATGNCELGMRTTTTKWSMQAGATLDSTVNYTTGAHAIRGKFANASGAINTDGTNKTGTVGSNQADGFTFAANRGESVFANIKTAFVGVYTGDVTTAAKWAQFQAWVLSYYGLTLG